MSTTHSGNVNGTDGHPQRPTQADSNFSDSSGPVFSLYTKIAVEEDDKTAERWKTNADGILIFSGLFSAAVATLLGVTIPDLKPNPQDISAFHLEKIFQILADPNVSQTVTRSTLTKQSTFAPQNYSVWVNLLWFLSLTLSLIRPV
ncbi:hypothetical protein F5888DRAFT_676245 [Russula emetica]|nr:hypothetical protein F5888DRAFT_676245 [Russula emetica]